MLTRERVHRWLKDRLGILASTKPGKWYDSIYLVVKAHNMAPFSDTGISPQEAFLGLKPSLKIDLLMRLGNSDASIIHANTPYTQEQKKGLHEQIFAKKRKEAERNIRNYNRPGSQAKNQYRPGDWVLVKNFTRSGTAPRFLGPYQVVQTPSPAYCLVRTKTWGKFDNIPLNVCHLKPYHWRDPIYDVAGMYFNTPIELAIHKVADEWTIQTQCGRAKGTSLGKYHGELLDQKEFMERYGNTDVKPDRVLSLRVDNVQYYIDSRDPRQSNWTRFIRHSTDNPSLVLVEKDAELRFETSQDLDADVELTCDFTSHLRHTCPKWVDTWSSQEEVCGG